MAANVIPNGEAAENGSPQPVKVLSHGVIRLGLFVIIAFLVIAGLIFDTALEKAGLQRGNFGGSSEVNVVADNRTEPLVSPSGTLTETVAHRLSSDDDLSNAPEQIEDNSAKLPGATTFIHPESTSQPPLSNLEFDEDLVYTGKKLFENNPVLYYGLYRRKYTSHYCLFGAARFTLAHNWKNRFCVFRNIGFDANGTLVYHVSPNAAKDGIVGFDREDPKTLFKGYDFPIRFAQDPIDLNQTYPKGRYVKDSLNVALIFGSVASNLAYIPGHDWEFLFWVFNGMFHSGLLSLDNELVLSKKPKFSTKLPKVWSALGRNPLAFDVFKEKAGGSLLPFVLVVPQIPEILGWPTLKSGLFASILRSRAFKMIGVKPFPPIYPALNPQASIVTPKIMVRLKTGNGHRFLNHDGMVQHLQSKCPKCRVMTFRPERLSLQQEMEEISSTHIYITPCGGGSMSAFLLPDGASAIIGDVCFPNQTTTAVSDRTGAPGNISVTCYHMDGPLWDAIPHLYTRYLNASTVSPLSDPRRAYLRYDFNVDFSQLDGYINAAFRSMGFTSFLYDGQDDE